MTPDRDGALHKGDVGDTYDGLYILRHTVES